MKCLICNATVKNYVALGLHLKKHNTNSKEYYDKYLKKPNEDICPICGKPNAFYGIRKGYSKNCSIVCSNRNSDSNRKREETCIKHYGVKNPYQAEEVKNKIKQKMLETTGYEYNLQNPKTIKKSKATKLKLYGDENYNNIEKMRKTNKEKYGTDYYWQSQDFMINVKDSVKHNPQKSYKTHLKLVEKQKQAGYVTIQEMLKQYGQSWYKNNIVPIIYKHHCGFITLSDAEKIKEYYENNSGHSSQEENIIFDILKKYYKGTIIRGDRSVLKSQELDFYLPDLKLAFEYNGTYWHSTKRKDNNYHFNKSLECFNKGIRLVHLYEFEDFNTIEDFIKSIFNKTEKPTNDFNKYSPLQFTYKRVSFSKETIIYKDEYDFIIYGSGTFSLR